jgi:medium-chain acyl-[acyl-carrier-protein] hydrolase
MTAATPWLHIARSVARPQLRLFCFPHAGGGASLFRLWNEGLPPTVEVCGAQLPGRESRWKEPLTERLEPLLDAFVPAVQAWLDTPFALYGHSMGALVAFEVARELRRRGLPGPKHLLVSGRRAPDLPDPTPPIRWLDDEAFVDAMVQQYDGIPDAIRRDREMLQIFLPILRADISVIETYRWREEAPLECPISVFAGLDDRSVDFRQLEAWRRFTTGEFRLEFLPGGHFFLQTAREGLLRSVARDLRGWRETSF